MGKLFMVIGGANETQHDYWTNQEDEWGLKEEEDEWGLNEDNI